MGTPFQNAGYTKDTKFNVVCGGGEVKIGDVVKLRRDDSSDCPLFQTLDGEREGYLIITTDIIPVVDEDAAASSTLTFKYPCAVELEGLTLEQVINLEKAFVKLGASVSDYFTEGDCQRRVEIWVYYGVDEENTTQVYDCFNSYSNNDEEVTLYTYDEVMKLADIGQEEQATPTYTGIQNVTEVTNSEGWILNDGT